MKLRLLTLYQPQANATGGSSQITLQNEYLIKNDDSVASLLSKGEELDLRNHGIIMKNIFFMMRYIAKDKEAIIRTSNCFVIDYSDLYSVLLLIIFVRLFSRKKIILTIHAIYFTYRKNKIKNLLDKVISFIAVHNVHGITTSGTAIDKYLLRWRVKAHRIRHIYPAVRPEFANLQMTPKADRIPVKILFVGRFHPIKGLDILIEALALCDKEKFSVYIVADDKQISYYTNCIKKLVQKKCLNENIIFCGKIGEEDKLIEIYKECDIFVQPSLWDTSPITIVEAMCAGLPIVASNVGGIPEWVEDGVTGILVPEGNSLKLAKAIKSLLEDRNLRLMMGSRGYEKSLILRRWTWEKACAEYREAIAGFLTGC